MQTWSVKLSCMHITYVLWTLKFKLFHFFNIGIITDPMCEDSREEDETKEHFLGSCLVPSVLDCARSSDSSHTGNDGFHRWDETFAQWTHASCLGATTLSSTSSYINAYIKKLIYRVISYYIWPRRMHRK